MSDHGGGGLTASAHLLLYLLLLVAGSLCLGAVLGMGCLADLQTIP